MEDINNIVTSEIPTQPIETPITPEPQLPPLQPQPEINQPINNPSITPSTLKKTKTEWFISIIFAIVGLGVLIGGVIIQINNTKFLKTAIQSTAVISNIDSHRDSDGDTSHTVYVFFKVNSVEYNGTLNEWNSGMYVGGTTKIYYNPKNPNNFKSGSSGFIGYILVVFGLIFFCVGSGMIFFTIKKKRNFQLLKQSGKRIEANIKDVSLNENFSVNGHHPYTIICSYVDPTTNKIYTFNSENIWFDVKTIIETNKILTICVYIDSSDGNKYFVDVEDFKKYLGN